MSWEEKYITNLVLSRSLSLSWLLSGRSFSRSLRLSTLLGWGPGLAARTTGDLVCGVRGETDLENDLDLDDDLKENQYQQEITLSLANENSKWKKTNCLKRGKTQLLLILNLIGWEDCRVFLTNQKAKLRPKQSQITLDTHFSALCTFFPLRNNWHSKIFCFHRALEAKDKYSTIHSAMAFNSQFNGYLDLDRDSDRERERVQDLAGDLE